MTKKVLYILLLLVLPILSATAQPGPVRAELDDALALAVEKPSLRNGHFYAKCSIERRWISAYLEGHPTVTLVVIDDTPRWYAFWRGNKVRGFYFDIKTGSNLGLTTRLDKSLAAAMRRALLHPQHAAVGRQGDSVLFCLVEHVPYTPQRFDRWNESQRSILTPWVRLERGDSLTLAFIPREQERRFRRLNDYDDYEQFTRNTGRPMAPYLVDFSWYGKANFLIEAQDLVFNDSLFSTVGATGITSTIVKNYDRLYVWENGFFRGSYSLTQLPDLTVQWKDLSSLHGALSFKTKALRTLPFNEKKYNELLTHYEDSIYALHRIALDSLGHPDRDLLEQYFTIYGKSGATHSGDIERTLYNMARQSMQWGQYYLHTYNRRQGRHYDEIDDLAFELVLKDFAQAQTYRDLFPNGRHLDEADEIVTFQKACRRYDVNIYTAQYPSGRYLDLFEEYMKDEEERLYNESAKIYSLDAAYDVETTLRNAVMPYRQHFPKGIHLREIDEMYYYGTAIQRHNASLYSAHYSIRSAHGQRLRQVLSRVAPTTTTTISTLAPVTPPKPEPSKDSQPADQRQEWLHKQILDMPVSQYTEIERLDNGDFLASSINLEVATTRKKSCRHTVPFNVTVSFDSQMGIFYILDNGKKKHISGSVFQTLKKQLLEGYDEQQGLLWDLEQWFLQNCQTLPR
jgi:hypothetical protein